MVFGHAIYVVRPVLDSRFNKCLPTKHELKTIILPNNPLHCRQAGRKYTGTPIEINSQHTNHRTDHSIKLMNRVRSPLDPKMVLSVL